MYSALLDHRNLLQGLAQDYLFSSWRDHQLSTQEVPLDWVVIAVIFHFHYHHQMWDIAIEKNCLQRCLYFKLLIETIISVFQVLTIATLNHIGRKWSLFSYLELKSLACQNNGSNLNQLWMRIITLYLRLKRKIISRCHKLIKVNRLLQVLHHGQDTKLQDCLGSFIQLF